METIKNVNVATQHNDDYRGYAIYVIRQRAIPDYRDGLKLVHRRILFAMYHDLRATHSKIKTLRVIGEVLGKYHPHGDSSVNDAIKPMVNWFEIYMPLIEAHGSFGNAMGARASDPRYTGVSLNKFTVDCVISELQEAANSVDWKNNYDDEFLEPVFLPAAVPLLLINGAFGIAVGMKTQVPKHNISEVIDATIRLIDHPNADIVLVPDNPMGSDIIETDFASISRTGRGKYIVRGRIEIGEYKGKPALYVKSLPDMVFFNSIEEKLEKIILANGLPQVSAIEKLSSLDKGGNEIFSAVIVLKKGSDPEFVKNIVYNATDMQKVIPVNFEVIQNDTPVLMNYKQYLLNFLEFRRQTKYRMYSNRLQEVKTKVHEIYLYILAMESGEIDNIIQMIRTQKGTDRNENIEYLVKKLKVTTLQAKFILSTNLEKFSAGYLAKYKQEVAKNEEKVQEFIQKITIPGEIDKELREELMMFKKKYGCPRRSKIISQSEVSGIPEGIFKLVFTKNNFIKKIGEHENIGSMSGDEVRYIFTANNTDNLLMFDSAGKVYKLPVHKIPFAAKGSNGIDIRMINKYFSANICCIVTESMVASIAKNKQNFIYVITENGFIKRMDLDDFLTVQFSGTIFVKLEDGDMVKDIIFMPEQCDILIYSRHKVLRINGSEAPHLRRITKGNKAMDTNYQIDGFSCLYPGATDIVVVTESGRINRVSIHGVPLSTRARAGQSIIKLGKTDNIKKILVCKPSNVVKITVNNEIKRIPVCDIPEGSSISAGNKMVSNPLKVELE